MYARSTSHIRVSKLLVISTDFWPRASPRGPRSLYVVVFHHLAVWSRVNQEILNLALLSSSSWTFSQFCLFSAIFMTSDYPNRLSRLSRYPTVFKSVLWTLKNYWTFYIRTRVHLWCKQLKNMGTIFLPLWPCKKMPLLYFDYVKSADFGSEKKILV